MPGHAVSKGTHGATRPQPHRAILQAEVQNCISFLVVCGYFCCPPDLDTVRDPDPGTLQGHKRDKVPADGLKHRTGDADSSELGIAAPCGSRRQQSGAQHHHRAPTDLLFLLAGILPICAGGHWGNCCGINEDQSLTPESFCKKGLKTSTSTPETEPGRYPSPRFLVLTQPRGSPSPAGSTPCPSAVGLALPYCRMQGDGEPTAPGPHCSSSASLQGARAAAGGRCPRCSVQAGTRPYCKLKKGKKKLL